MRIPRGFSVTQYTSLWTALALLLAASATFNSSPVAAAYDCFSAPNGGHCYGRNEWYGSTTGAYTHVSLFPMYIAVSPGRMTMEMWVDDQNSPACPNDLCWVEAGYTWAAGPTDCYGQGTGCLRYFNAEYIWGTGYVESIDFPPVASADLNRGDIGIEIWMDPTHAYYGIIIYTASGNVQKSGYNAMNPNIIEIGTELSGTDGAHGQQTWWDTNIWLLSNYAGQYQVRPAPFGPAYGNNQVDNVPSVVYADFYIPPSYYQNGGTWRAFPPP